MPEGFICPSSNVLPTIAVTDCRDVFGNAAKFIFQIYASSNNFDGTASPSTAIDLADSWSGLPDASDGTKVTVTPFVSNVSLSEQNRLEGVENYQGDPTYIGRQGTVVMFDIVDPTQTEQTAIETLVNFTNLVVYVLDKEGNFLCKLVDTDIHNGLPLSPRTFSVSDPFREAGSSGQMITRCQFTLPSKWFKDTAYVAPETGFDTLNAIIPS